MRWMDVPLMQSSATLCDVPVSVAVVQMSGEMGADGGTNADTAGGDKHAPPIVAAVASARVAAADLVDVEEAIFARSSLKKMRRCVTTLQSNESCQQESRCCAGRSAGWKRKQRPARIRVENCFGVSEFVLRSY